MEDAPELLRLFIDRVDKLRMSAYVKDVSERGLKLTIKGNRQQQHLRFIHTGAEPGHVDAYLFNLRVLIQKDDSISIKNICDLVSSMNLRESAPKERMNKMRESLDKYLGEPNWVTINGARPTNDEILRTFLYGYLGHVKTETPAYKRYKEWESIPGAKDALIFAFNDVLITYLEILNSMANNCRLILDELMPDGCARGQRPSDRLPPIKQVGATFKKAEKSKDEKTERLRLADSIKDKD